MLGLLSMMTAAHAWQDTAMAYGRMYLSAQEVIQHRTMQMALGQMGTKEAMIMVFEKPTAFAAAFESAATATAAGQNPVAVALAAIKPISAKTSANAKRLRRS